MAQTLQNKQQQQQLPSSKTSTTTTIERPRQLKKPLTLPTLDDMEEEQQKRQQRWSRKGIASPPLLTPESNRDDDPFAGMTTGVNYQQEIERLKSLVPKVDGKKGGRRPRSVGAIERKLKPIVSPTGGAITTALAAVAAAAAASNNSNTNNSSSNSGSSNRRASPPAHHQRPSTTETTPSSSPYYDANSRVTSPSLSTPRSLSPVQSDYTSMTIPPVPEEDEEQQQQQHQQPPQQQSSVITEEEKTRFLQFMRSWTGGWKGWERNDEEDEEDQVDGHYSGMESVRSGGSLWAEQLPWTKQNNHSSRLRRCSWQEGPRSRTHHHHHHQLHHQYHHTDHRPLAVTLPDRKFDISMRSEPCTPLLAPR
ncbi:hypothetical protein BDB00DRAFT_844377 [Zychaea mexicana]|uniref:uncharacterized protein n=1 Tax=Zychaea mexicana TaxID=64656 RepID=UPI0022FF2338|nr:uncharacterized protein BDB00DRAFT_844377 [Zychaea mexicana]KAI9489217.1 hypothetical protein BDB00DRAFT_844377 [Zychaea mexicana]